MGNTGKNGVSSSPHSRAAAGQQSTPIKIAAAHELDNFQPDVLLLTAVDIEFQAMLETMRPLARRRHILQVIRDKLTYFVGRCGAHKVALVRSEKGASGRDGSLSVTAEAVSTWSSSAVIAVGIAFGVNAKKQALGDVLVSTIVHAYEPQRIGHRTIYRGPSPEAGVVLLDRFRNAQGWMFQAEPGKISKIQFGPLLSGEKLVDNRKFKQSLLKAYPDSIGGEMEATGVYAAASRAGVEWIIVKGICDWGEGKDKTHQRLAAAAAASLTQYVLSKRGSISGPSIRHEPNREKIFDVPYIKNNFFTGREQELKRIQRALRTRKSGAVVLTQTGVLSGLGGVGKTQIAVEYAYRRGKQYDNVFWIRADSMSNIIGAITRSLRLLNLPKRSYARADYAVAEFRRWLEDNASWLIIADNADEPNLLSTVLPMKGKGHVILTSRAIAFDVLNIDTIVEVHGFNQLEALDFLFHRVIRQQEDSPQETDAARELVEELECLPLALEQAGAYILTKSCSFRDYLSSYRRRRLELLEQSQPITGDYPYSVATTWSINFREVEKASKASAELLEFSAFLAPDKIPIELFEKTGSELPSALRGALSNVTDNPVQLDELLAPLSRYSLIRRHHDNRTYSIHRLVQLVLRSRLSIERQRLYLEHLVDVLQSAIPDSVDPQNWKGWERILPQVQHLRTFREEWGFNTRDVGRLLTYTAGFCMDRGRYDEAEQLFTEAGEILREPHISGTFDKILWLRRFAQFSQCRGELPRAIELYKECQRELELSDEPRTLWADILFDLASLYLLVDPVPYIDQMVLTAIATYEQEYGSDSPDIASSFLRGAQLFRRMGDMDFAYRLARDAYKLVEDGRFEGDDLPADILVEIAKILRAQGDYETAEAKLEKAQGYLNQLGGRVLETCEVLDEMARLSRARGDLVHAIQLHTQSIGQQEKVRGRNHPDLRPSLLDYSETLKAAGNETEALRIDERAQQLYDKYARWDSRVKRIFV